MEVPGDPGADEKQYTNVEYERLYEWSDLGIDITDLEILVSTDHEKYEKIKHRIMKYQLEGVSPDDINSYIYQSLSGLEPDQNIDEPLLIGSPLEDFEPSLDSDDEIDIDLDELEKESTIQNDNFVDIRNGAGIYPEQSQVDSETEDLDLDLTDDIKNIDEHLTRRKIHSRSLIISGMIAAVILILTGGSIYYLLNMESNGDIDRLDPSFTISNEVPLEGTVINIDSSVINDNLEHQWNINPDTYEILSDNEYSNNLTLYFKKSGNYSIEHKLISDSEEKSTVTNLEVSPLTIRVNRESYGDESRYDIDGKMTMQNIENILDIPESIDFRDLEMEFRTAQNHPQTIGISSDTVFEKDGYGNSYEQVKRDSNERLIIVGSIMDKKGAKIPFSGTSDLQQNTMIDLYLKKPMKSIIHHESSIVIAFSPVSKTYDLSENYEMYPILARDYQELRIEDISDDRTFHVGDNGDTLWGSYSFGWESVNVDIVDGIPCMNLSLSLDTYTREKLDIEYFKMNLWVAQSYPVAIRTDINIISKEDAYNAYALEYTQTLNDFQSGENPIIYGTVESAHEDITDIENIWPYLGYQFHDDYKYAPRQGNLTSSIPEDFDAETAIEEFEDSALFKNFIRNLDEPYCLVSNITKGYEGLEKFRWKFTISENDQSWGFNQTVIQDSSISPGSQVRIKPILVSKSDISELLTYSGAEEAFKQIMGEIDTDVLRDLYGVPEPGSSHVIDLEDYALLTIADNPYPNIGMVNPSIIESIPYCLVIRSVDNSFELGLDMCSGQVCYMHYKSVRYE